LKQHYIYPRPIGSIDKMDLSKVSGIGFVGLGAMGLPMAGHLANKLPQHIRLFVYDINQSSVDQLYIDHPDRVVKASSGKNVADQSVWIEDVQYFGARLY
jgi:UDP-N-acetyl-D-mannosaminuronate dehydrogenase